MPGTEESGNHGETKCPITSRNPVCLAVTVAMGFLFVANLILLIVLGISKLSSVDSAGVGYVSSSKRQNKLYF